MSISHTAVRTRKPVSCYKMAESTYRNMHFASSRQKGTVSLCLFCSRWQGGISHDLWPRNSGKQVSESRRLMRLHQAPGCYLESVCLGKDTVLRFGLEALLSHLLMSYWWYCGKREKKKKSPTISLSINISVFLPRSQVCNGRNRSVTFWKVKVIWIKIDSSSHAAAEV